MIILPLVKIGVGFAAGMGASNIAKMAISKIVTSEESTKLIIKLGTIALSGVAAGVAYKHTVETFDAVENLWKKGVESINKIKEEVRKKKEEETIQKNKEEFEEWLKNEEIQKEESTDMVEE